MSKFGYQPIRDLLVAGRWTVPSLHREINEPGITRGHLYNAVYGKTPPSPQLRSALRRVLGASDQEMFSADSINAVYSGPRSNGYRRVGCAL